MQVLQNHAMVQNELKNTQINETLCVAFNEMYVSILSGSDEDLYCHFDLDSSLSA